MPKSEPSERRYSEKEVQNILERAAELQEQTPLTPAPPEGLSLPELVQAAQEAGIEPGLVRRAAAELDASTGLFPGLSWLLGHPSELRLEQHLPVEVPASALPQISDLIQSRLDLPGQAQVLGSSLRWHPIGVPRLLQISVVPQPGGTTIRIHERFAPLIGGLFGGIVGGVGGGLGGAAAGLIGGLAGSVSGGLLAAVAAVVGSYGLARSIFVRVALGRHRQLAELADALAADVSQLALPAGQEPMSP